MPPRFSTLPPLVFPRGFDYQQRRCYIYGYAKPFYGSDDGNTPIIVGSARKQAFLPIKIDAADIGAAVVFEPVPGVAWICSRISLTGTRFDGRHDATARLKR